MYVVYGSILIFYVMIVVDIILRMDHGVWPEVYCRNIHYNCYTKPLRLSTLHRLHSPPEDLRYKGRQSGAHGAEVTRTYTGQVVSC